MTVLACLRVRLALVKDHVGLGLVNGDLRGTDVANRGEYMQIKPGTYAKGNMPGNEFSFRTRANVQHELSRLHQMMTLEFLLGNLTFSSFNAPT